MFLDKFLLELNDPQPLDKVDLGVARHLLGQDCRQLLPMLQLRVGDSVPEGEVYEVLESTRGLLSYKFVKNEDSHFLLVFCDFKTALAFKRTTLCLVRDKNVDVSADFLPCVPEHVLASQKHKLTARFDILAEPLPGFEISKRIIGPCGKNMKAIIAQCETQYTANTLKLRLRGQGSSYLEGPNNMESEEALHLCVSSRNSTVFSAACDSVETLLFSIEKQYNACRRAAGLWPIGFFQRKFN